MPAPPATCLFTSGAIGLVVDSGRLLTYWSQGVHVDPRLLWGLLVFVPVSFAGAKVAERVVEGIPQSHFQAVIAVLLGRVALQLLLAPGATRPP